MRKLFKTAFLSFSALLIPFSIAIGAKAEDETISDDIDTKLEYQLSADGEDMRFISTMELKNDRTLSDITKIDMSFTLKKDGEEDKTKTIETTTVYDVISGENGKPKVDNTYYAVFKITDLKENYEGWTIDTSFTYTYTDASTDIAECSDWIIGGSRIYFQNTNNWSNVNVYFYGTGDGNNNGWPGVPMTYNPESGLYYLNYYYPTEEYHTIIFNNGNGGDGNQTADLKLGNGHHYTVDGATDHNFVPDTSTQNWHVCSICGYSKSHHLEVTNENGNYRTVTCTECGFTYTFDTTKIYFTKSLSYWENVYVHRWGGTYNGEGWPGVLLSTPIAKNENNEDIYEINLDGATSLLFHDNTEDNKWHKSSNIDLASYECFNAFYYYLENNETQVLGGYLYIPSSTE